MRSFVALALISRALALPQSITPTDAVTTTSNDPALVPLFVEASVLRRLCSKMPNEPECTNARLFTPADLCRSAATGSDDDAKFAPLLKLALSKLKSEDGDDDGTATPAPSGAVKTVVAGVKAKLAGDDDDSSASPAPTNDVGATLATVKTKLLDGNDENDAAALEILHDALESCDCETEAPTSTESDSGAATLSVSLTASASATATESVQRRELDTYIASKLASLHATATRAATSSESASPTGFSRSGSNSGALAVDELFNSFESGSSDSPTETEDALVKRDLSFLSATRIASVGLTAARTATSTQSASPTGYSGSSSDASSFSYDSVMDSALTQFEDADDMPMYV